MGCFMYAVFGSCKDVTVGPTAIMSLMTAEYASKLGPDFAVLSAFLSGCIIFCMGFFKLGFVIDFISVSVTAGFTSAAAISIATGQVDELLGLEKKWHSESHGIQGDIYEIIRNIDTIRWQDTTMGLICSIVLLYMRWMKNNTWFVHQSEVEQPTCMQRLTSRIPSGPRKALEKTIWLLSTARNAVIVVICILVAYLFNPKLPTSREESTFILTGEVEGGLPPFELPPFSTTDVKTGKEYDFMGMLSALGSGIIIIPLISVLENMAIAKSFCKFCPVVGLFYLVNNLVVQIVAGGKPVDANQEMVAVGICNFMGSFVSSYPTTGSFSRTAVNSASGVATPFGGIYTGALVMLALAVLMPGCAYIPKSALAAVIITAVIFSVEFHVVRPMWRSKSKYCSQVVWHWNYPIFSVRRVRSAGDVCHVLLLHLLVFGVRHPGRSWRSDNLRLVPHRQAQHQS